MYLLDPTWTNTSWDKNVSKIYSDGKLWCILLWQICKSCKTEAQKHYFYLIYKTHLAYIIVYDICKSVTNLFSEIFLLLSNRGMGEMIKIGHRLVRDFLAFLYQEISFGDNNRHKSWAFCTLLWNNTRSVSLTIFLSSWNIFPFSWNVKNKVSCASYGSIKLTIFNSWWALHILYEMERSHYEFRRAVHVYDSNNYWGT